MCIEQKSNRDLMTDNPTRHWPTDGTLINVNKQVLNRKGRKMLCLLLFCAIILQCKVVSSNTSFESTKNDVETSVGTKDSKDDYINLDDMSDDDLEEICTSRGFELVRELNTTTGDVILNSHQDYVDAASECLQIEADLEEILSKHPEILEDVKLESERMMQERDLLQEQLKNIIDKEKMNDLDAKSEPESRWGLNGRDTIEGLGETSGYHSDGEEGTPRDDSDSSKSSQQSNIVDRFSSAREKPIYDLKEITLEVVRQMKSDFAKVLNILVPEPLREQLSPAIGTLLKVAKNMGQSMYDLVRRYLVTFLRVNMKSGATGETSSCSKEENQSEPPEENDVSSRSEGST